MAEHFQEASVVTLLDASPEQAPIKAIPDWELPSSPIIVEGDPSVIPPEHPYRTLVLWYVAAPPLSAQTLSVDLPVLTELVISSMKTFVLTQYHPSKLPPRKFETSSLIMRRQTLDEMVAWNLDRHVMGKLKIPCGASLVTHGGSPDGYEFLMQNYKAGDRICIFGFSRGAYTARALAGMIHKVGLLPACNHQQVPFAYKMFKRADETGWKQSNTFKKAFSVDVDIEFIGVWDTVNSVGLIPRRLPFTTSNTIVRTFRHAVALDERRAKFKPNLWNRPSNKEQTLSTSDRNRKAHKKHAHDKTPRLKALERKYTKDHTRQTDIEEVCIGLPFLAYGAMVITRIFFARSGSLAVIVVSPSPSCRNPHLIGMRTDVGGGSVSNDTQHSLARIPLRWMIRECFKTHTGIMFDCEGLQALGLDPGMLYPEVLPRPPMSSVTSTLRIQDIPKPLSTSSNYPPNFAGVEEYSALYKSEEDHDMLDTLSPVYDQLSLAPSWWVLEIWPMKQRYQKGDNSWGSYIGCNLGGGRFIPKQKKRGVKIHRSVQMRMEALHSNGTKYVPRASFEKAVAAGKVQWVD
ncbi:hypothetical protein EYR36_009055 [Pleurotus pulmonarius]|nr:hypothetical protein EYR36_009055 [Pleurotus pulmonarius]